MRRKGINYDVGTFTRANESSRPELDPVIMRRELEIIKRDLHCTAIRISGQDVERLTLAADYALRLGLEVWISPALVDATEEETLAYLARCAQEMERLREQFPALIFVVGCELTFFMKGLVDGETALERMATFMKPWRLVKSTLVRGPFNKRLNAFLARAAATVRETFHGQVTYTSGPWEAVDWRPFDFVGVDYYRDARNKATFQKTLRKYFAHGKPVVILEFGCCTYTGAEEKGGYGWAIVNRKATPQELRGTFARDEAGQARYLLELLDIFEAEGVEGAFVFTFVMPSYPAHDDPRYDLDMASYGVVRSYEDRMGETYAGLPWEPKESFRQLAQRYATAAVPS